MDKLGRALTKAVAAHNQTVGSLESRVLPSARRLAELSVGDGGGHGLGRRLHGGNAPAAGTQPAGRLTGRRGLDAAP